MTNYVKVHMLNTLIKVKINLYPNITKSYRENKDAAIQ